MFINFREILEHENITFNDNGTMSFDPKRSYITRSDLSFGNLTTDTIVTPNIILLGASTMASEMSSFAAFGLSTLARSLESKPILNMRVHDLLYGYEDPLVSLASTVVPSFINFERFGLLDRVIYDNLNLKPYNHCIIVDF